MDHSWSRAIGTQVDPKQHISGLIITSKRAVKAWCEVVQALPIAHKNVHPSDSAMSIDRIRHITPHGEQTGGPCRSM
ncbi:hypothetical protein AZE42_13958 [Rhizopogon vesiculosus]|uniref:Uroporphyrinogen-III synthase n=1 Tax=Rhizopogon vesiculosus TaxID=180088 RepID=A0A1J8PNM1_9AGAM|nr:hypothetical protein AZE42_13958 [Rhizopogon vesiculosus]